MSEARRWIGTGAALGGAGVLLYLFITRLGKGGGIGGAPGITSDAQRLSFVMVLPTTDDPSRPVTFRGPDARTYSLGELLGRVWAGGRADVALRAAGDVRQGAWSSALAIVKQAGIEVWTEAGARVSGRGSYA